MTLNDAPPDHWWPPGRRSRAVELRPARAVVGATRAVVAAVCVAVAAVVLSLLGWTLLPMVVGWQPTVVLTGSMEPQIARGDVVLSAPPALGDIQPGRVLWFADPARPGTTLLHRAVTVAHDGSIVTRGDANQSDDAYPVQAAAVLGLPRLRVPVVGLPVVWAGDQRWDLVAATVAGLGLVLHGAALTLGSRP